MEFQIYLKISVFSEFLFFEFIQAVSHASLALHQEFSFFLNFRFFRISAASWGQDENSPAN